MKKIVFENSYQKCGGKTIPRLNLRISLDHKSKVLNSLNLLYDKVKTKSKLLKLSCRTLAFTLFKALNARILMENIYLVSIVLTDQI